MTYGRFDRIAWALLATVIAVQMVATTASAVIPGHHLWVARYDGSISGADYATRIAISPDGSKVFVTGYSPTGLPYDQMIVTIAYDASTGAQIWSASFDTPYSDTPSGIAVSRDGTEVLVLASTYSPGTGNDISTIAYDTASGTQLWVSTYQGEGASPDYPSGLVASSGGTTVFVTGSTFGRPRSGTDYVTIAYAADGTQRWAVRYNGKANGTDTPTAIALSADGSRVIVTGQSDGNSTYGDRDYATVAYDASTGIKEWVRRYDVGSQSDRPSAVAVSPDGASVFVTGSIQVIAGETDYATIGYDALTGARLWVSRYDGPGHVFDVPQSIAVGPDDGLIFVTGTSYGGTTVQDDYATVAYDAVTGSQRWVSSYDGSAHGNDDGVAVAIFPDGSEVIVTGTAYNATSGTDDTTIAYAPATGAPIWSHSYDGPAHQSDYAAAMAMSPDGSKVVVTGSSQSWSIDYATVAYAA